MTQEIGNKEAFDAGKSTIIEVKNYFDKKQLIHQIQSQEADVLLTEQHSNLEYGRIFDLYQKSLRPGTKINSYS